MDECNLSGDAEFFGTAFRLFGKEPAQVDAGADNAVIPRPGTQHFPRTAAEVEHPSTRFQPQRLAESGELFGGDRVVDAVSAFGDVEDAGDVHCGEFPYGCEWILAGDGQFNSAIGSQINFLRASPLFLIIIDFALVERSGKDLAVLLLLNEQENGSGRAWLQLVQ